MMNISLETLLIIATVIGGISAIIYFFDSFKNNLRSDSDVKMDKVLEQLFKHYQIQLNSKDKQQVEALTEAIKALAKIPNYKYALQQLEKGSTEGIESLFAKIAKEKVEQGVVANRDAAIAQRQLGALAFKNNTQEAIQAYRKATELDPDNPDGWNQLGQLLYRIGKLTESESAFKKVLTWAEKNNDTEWQSIAYGNLGNIYGTRGELDKAEEYYLHSLEIEKELGRKEGIADNYANLGIIYKTRGELDKAEEYYLQSLEINKALGRKEGMAIQYGNLGIIYLTRGKLDKAEEYYLQSLEINKALGRKEGMAIQYDNLGKLYIQQGNLEKGERMLSDSFEIFKELKHREGMANNYCNFGRLHEKRNEWNKAEEMYRQSLRLYAEMGALENKDAKETQDLLDKLLSKIKNLQ